MSRWFRHYAGMVRDEKLVKVAVKSRQSVERVVWVWGAILESAAGINDGGRYELDAGEAAYFLRCNEDDILCVIACLEGIGRLSQGVVVRWSDRQFDSDSSRERQRRYRERNKANGDVRERNGDGAKTSRDGVVTLQDTDTDTELNTSSLRSDVCPEPDKSAPTSPTVIELPATQNQIVKITEADVDEWRSAFPAVDVSQKLKAIRAWLIANPQRRKTVRGMRKFVVAWLSREQDRGGIPSGAGPPQQQARKSAFQDRQDQARDRLSRKLGIGANDHSDYDDGNVIDLGRTNYRG